MSKTVRVLHIEDSEDDAALIARQFRRGGFTPEFHRIDTLEAARAALTEQTWDLVLCDYSLPGFNAQDVFSILRENKRNIPVIIISGTVGEETAVDCMRAGVRDFVLKDRLSRLLPAIERELEEAALRTEQVQMREQLRRAEDALAQSERLRSLGQMAAGIAHDLKNLLNPLSMLLQLLDRQVLRNNPDAAHKKVEEMRSIVQTGVQMIDRLHAFSRQAPENKPEAIDINCVAHEALELARPRMAQNHGTPCHLREDLGTPPLIQGSRSELVSALVNLISNAIDAMPHGGAITLRTGEEPGGAWIQVIDDGPGMLPEVEKRAFDPFFSTKGEAGMGLGLAMVYSTVMRHAGRIALATEPGKGTIFSLSFPAPSRTEPLRGSHVPSSSGDAVVSEPPDGSLAVPGVGAQGGIPGTAPAKDAR